MMQHIANNAENASFHTRMEADEFAERLSRSDREPEVLAEFGE